MFAAARSSLQQRDRYDVMLRKDSFLYVIALVLAWANLLCAQQDQRLSGESATTNNIREALPPIVFTPDEAGKPDVAVIPLEWDELDQFLRKARRNEKPQYAIDSLKLDVIAKDGRAVVQNEIQFRVLTDGIVVVPINMGSVNLNSVPTSQDGPIGARLNPEFDDWELVVDGKKGEAHIVKFESLVPLKQLGNETHLRLTLPRVPKSEMQIRVPLKDANARLFADGALSQRFDSTENDVADSMAASSSSFMLRGLPAELDFVWFARTATSSDEDFSFEVDGDIEVEVDALEGLLCDAVLTANSLNKPIESLIVRIPENTRLVANDESRFGDYQVTEIETTDESDGRREVRVAFDEPLVNPPAVRLKVKAEKELTQFELAGFEVSAVEGERRYPASSESDVVKVISLGTRRLQMKPGDFARRISGDSNQSRGVATFEYSRPNQIQLLISRQETELVVEPTYIIEVEESRATLTAIFQCSSSGGNIDSLVFDDMGEWTSFQGIYRDPDGVTSDVTRFDEQLEIPLTNTTDSFEVSFRARMLFIESLDANKPKKLELRFPVPRDAKRILQSKIAIVSPSNIVSTVEATNQYTETKVLDLAQGVADELGATTPKCLIKRATGGPGVLTVFASKLVRKTDVASEVEITDLEWLDATKLRIGVKQTMHWQVGNVPLDAAYLRMNKAIHQDEDETANLQVKVDGVSRLRQDVSRVPELIDIFSDSVSMQVLLEPRLGDFEMELTYDWIHEAADLSSFQDRLVSKLRLPLVLPRRVSRTADLNSVFRLIRPRLTGYQVSLSEADDFDANWLASSDVTNPNPDVEAFLNPEIESTPNSIPIEIRSVEVNEAETEFEELVDRAWFQTWLTHEKRWDRAVFRVKGGGGDGIRIEMPQSDYRKLYAFVDGEQTELTRVGDTVELDVNTTTNSHVVELQYWSDRREPPGLLTTVVPKIEGADIIGQWYWHIVMPRNECMVTWPRTLTRAHQMDWSAVIPMRRPQLSLAELEEWSGATSTGDKVLAGSTQYLFGAMGETTTLSIRTTLLPIYVLALSGCMLVFGVLMLYYRRRALTLLVVSAIIAGLVFLHPSYASVAGQVAVFGLLLVVVMTFLRWLTDQTVVRRRALATHESAFDVSPGAVRDSAAATIGSTTLAVGSSRVRPQ